MSWRAAHRVVFHQLNTLNEHFGDARSRPMPAPGITERVDSHGLVTFGLEGEARLLHNSPTGAAVADGPSKPSLHHRRLGRAFRY
jgi:hypothetical protein